MNPNNIWGKSWEEIKNCFMLKQIHNFRRKKKSSLNAVAYSIQYMLIQHYTALVALLLIVYSKLLHAVSYVGLCDIPLYAAQNLHPLMFIFVFHNTNEKDFYENFITLTL